MTKGEIQDLADAVVERLEHNSTLRRLFADDLVAAKTREKSRKILLMEKWRASLHKVSYTMGCVCRECGKEFNFFAFGGEVCPKADNPLTEAEMLFLKATDCR